MRRVFFPRERPGLRRMATSLLLLAISLPLRADSVPAQERSATILATGRFGASLYAYDGRGSHTRMANSLVYLRGQESSRLLLVAAGLMDPHSTTWEWESWDRFRLVWDLMAEAGFDAVTPGRFALGTGLRRMERLFRTHPDIAVVSANLRGAEGDSPFPPFVMVEKGGVRFGITGVTPAPWSFQRTGDQLDYRLEDQAAALARVVPRMRPDCDVVVVLLTEAYGEELDSIRRVEGIDVLVVGGVPYWNDDDDPDRLRALRDEGGTFGRMRIGLDASGRVHGDRRLFVHPQIDESLDPRLARQIRLATERLHEREMATRTWLKDLGMWRRDPGRGEISSGPTAFYARGPNGPFRLTFLGKRDTRLHFAALQLPTVPLSAPLWEALRDLVSPTALYRVDREDSLPPVPLAVGGEVEGEVILAAANNAARYFDSERALSLVQGDTMTEESILLPLLPEERAAIGALRLALVLRAQEQWYTHWPAPYWERRALVYLGLTCDSLGTVGTSEILSSYADPATADSLREAMSGARIPVPGWAAGRATFPYLAVFATDPREERLDPYRGAADHLAQWKRDGLLDCGDVSLRVEPLPEAIRQALHEGVLRTWTEILESMDPGCHVETFLSTDQDMGPEVLEEVVRGDGVVLSSWITRRKLVLVGWSEVAHARLSGGTMGTIRVPTVWVGNSGLETMRRYQCAPLSPFAQEEVGRAVDSLRGTTALRD